MRESIKEKIEAMREILKCDLQRNGDLGASEKLWHYRCLQYFWREYYMDPVSITKNYVKYFRSIDVKENLKRRKKKGRKLLAFIEQKFRH